MGKNKCKLFTVIGVMLFLLLPLLRAEDLDRQKSFLYKQGSGIIAWLDKTRLSPVIQYKDMEITADQAVIKLTVPDLKQWKAINDRCLETYNRPAWEICFDKFVFLLEITALQLTITAEGADVVITISYDGDKFIELAANKLNPVSNTVSYPVADLKVTRNFGYTMTRLALKDLKADLAAGLKDFFQPYAARFSPYKFTVISQLNMELALEVSGVKGVILEDGSYFEYIRLDLRFEEVNGEIRILYQVGAKYGSGLIWAPQQSDYRDLDPKYTANVERFAKMLGAAITALVEG